MIDYLSEHLHREYAAVPPAEPATLDEIAARADDRTRRLFVVRGSGAMAVAVLAGLVVLAAVPFSPQMAAAQTGGLKRLVIAGTVRLPVEGPIGQLTSYGSAMPLYRGLPGPSMAFDPVSLGHEQPLVSRQPRWDKAVSTGNVPVVYVGDVVDRSVFVHTNGAISWLDRIVSAVLRRPHGPHVCVTAVQADEESSGWCFTSDDMGAGIISVDEPPNAGVDTLGRSVLTWVGVPPGTAVVTVKQRDDRRLWQRPVGNTAYLILDGEWESVAALDGEGRELYQRAR